MLDERTTRDRIALLRGLRSVRQFRPDPLPPAVVNDLVEVARWSGSARNQQPWELVMVRDREMLAALAALDGYADHLAGAALGIVLVMAGEREETETFDEGKVSERIMLAAAAHGVGSCIGWLTGDGRAGAKALLGIPTERLVRTALSLGYPDEEARRARPKRDDVRKSVSEIVYQERYG